MLTVAAREPCLCARRDLSRCHQPAYERVGNRSEPFFKRGPVQDAARRNRVLQFQLPGTRALGLDLFEVQRAVDRGGNLLGQEQTAGIRYGGVFSEGLSQGRRRQAEFDPRSFDRPTQGRLRHVRFARTAHRSALSRSTRVRNRNHKPRDVVG